MSTTTNPILDLIRLRPCTPSAPHSPSSSSPSKWYSSLSHPFRMGNAADIAYGGCALAVLTASAFQYIEAKHLPRNGSDSGDFAIYTASGVYLRPASTKSNFVTEVEGLRSTRTFETVVVRVYQPVAAVGEGKLNLCMFGTLDFMRRSDGGVDRSILTHSTQPRLTPTAGTLTHHTSLLSEPQAMQQRASRGELPSAIVTAVEKTFGPMRTFTGIWGPTAWGALKKRAKVEQHALPVAERVGYDWLRTIGSLVDDDVSKKKAAAGDTLPISTASASASLITFILDGALSFAPLSYTQRFLDDAAACASLDFAIRYHQEDNAGVMDASKRREDQGWLLREIRTRESAWERTYNEGVLFEELGGKEGGFRAVATMTQACVLKSRREQKAKL